jgi:hypothetical protein
LAPLLESTGSENEGNLVGLSKLAKKKGLITSDEFDVLDALRDFRNPTVHSLDKPWMVPDRVVELDNPGSEIQNKVLQTQGSKDFTNLAACSEMAWVFLTRVIGIMRQRYPSKNTAPYVMVSVIRHGTTNAFENAIKSRSTQRAGGKNC